jgi:O-methyltransferase
MARFAMKLYYVMTVPFSLFFILYSRRIHPAYKMTSFKKLVLGLRMFRNAHRIRTGTSFKTHLVMALKLLEAAPDSPGCVIECGTWKGGSAANLSLVCKITGRRLLIYDSFEGLPEGNPKDRESKFYNRGDYCGTLEEVKANIRRYGDLGSCQFFKGWFSDTLPELSSTVFLAFLDVDLETSLDTCIRCIWPRLADEGYIFIDEYVSTDYCSLFYSERYWRTYFDRTPPGLIGAGSGLALGEYYVGPWSDRDNHPTQHPSGPAYTQKNMSGYWSYYPDPAQDDDLLTEQQI